MPDLQKNGRKSQYGKRGCKTDCDEVNLLPPLQRAALCGRKWCDSWFGWSVGEFFFKQVGGITISREEALANYYEDIDEDELDGSDVPNVCWSNKAAVWKN